MARGFGSDGADAEGAGGETHFLFFSNFLSRGWGEGAGWNLELSRPREASWTQISAIWEWKGFGRRNSWKGGVDVFLEADV